ncbi:MAG: diguanylate cyclase [Nitrospinota bacterium]|nr:diguanylate cyclase [Nitrospinota bacterium]
MKILLVDDSKDSRFLLEEVLKKLEGSTIFTAPSASEAIEILGINGTPDRSFDLILLDIMMPGIDGIEACLLIKQEPVFADIPIIMVTASTDESDLERAFEAGAIDYVQKPIRKTELRARVRSALKLKYEMDRRKELLVKLEEANKKLEFISTHDALTGLVNRRYFDEAYENEWKRSFRNKTPISILMIDIDHFKKYNDTYGHQKGDTCLARVAGIIGGLFKRPGDVAARYGGEEFVVVLPNTDAEHAVVIAEKARMKVHEAAIVHEDSEVSKVVTLSIGVATEVPELASGAESLLNNADAALYDAKKSGRNKVAVFKSLKPQS